MPELANFSNNIMELDPMCLPHHLDMLSIVPEKAQMGMLNKMNCWLFDHCMEMSYVAMQRLRSALCEAAMQALFVDKARPRFHAVKCYYKNLKV